MGPAIRKVPLFPTRYRGVSVSRETWVMLVKEIFCVCSRVFWWLKASRCFTWNVGCFLLWVGVVFWVLVFLVGGGCFTWNMEASVAGKKWFSFSTYWCMWPFPGGLEKQAAWHVGIKETYSDVYGSWIAFSSQLTKRYWFHDGLAVSRETQGGVVVSSLPVAWDWGSFNGVFHVKHGELLTGGDWSALFSFTGCCGGVWCFTWNIDISVDNEAYSSLGKTIYISRWRIRKSMSASLVFLAPRSESCVGVLNKLHGFTWNAVG